jgi:hypothetical protein
MANLQNKARLFAGNLLPATGEYMIDPVHTFAEFTVQNVIVGMTNYLPEMFQPLSRNILFIGSSNNFFRM